MRVCSLLVLCGSLTIREERVELAAAPADEDFGDEDFGDGDADFGDEDFGDGDADFGDGDDDDWGSGGDDWGDAEEVDDFGPSAEDEAEFKAKREREALERAGMSIRARQADLSDYPKGPRPVTITIDPAPGHSYFTQLYEAMRNPDLLRRDWSHESLAFSLKKVAKDDVVKDEGGVKREVLALAFLHAGLDFVLASPQPLQGKWLPLGHKGIWDEHAAPAGFIGMPDEAAAYSPSVTERLPLFRFFGQLLGKVFFRDRDAASFTLPLELHDLVYEALASNAVPPLPLVAPGPDAERYPSGTAIAECEAVADLVGRKFHTRTGESMGPYARSFTGKYQAFVPGTQDYETPLYAREDVWTAGPGAALTRGLFAHLPGGRAGAKAALRERCANFWRSAVQAPLGAVLEGFNEVLGKPLELPEGALALKRVFEGEAAFDREDFLEHIDFTHTHDVATVVDGVEVRGELRRDAYYVDERDLIAGKSPRESLEAVLLGRKENGEMLVSDENVKKLLFFFTSRYNRPFGGWGSIDLHVIWWQGQTAGGGDGNVCGAWNFAGKTCINQLSVPLGCRIALEGGQVPAQEQPKLRAFATALNDLAEKYSQGFQTV